MAADQEELWKKVQERSEGHPKNDLEMIADAAGPLAEVDPFNSQSILTVLDDRGSYIQLDATDSTAMRLLEGSLADVEAAEEEMSLVERFRKVRDAAINQVKQIIPFIASQEEEIVDRLMYSELTSEGYSDSIFENQNVNLTISGQDQAAANNTLSNSSFYSMPQMFSVGIYEVTVSSVVDALVDNPYQSIAYQSSADLANAYHPNSENSYLQTVSDKLDQISNFIESGDFDRVVDELDGRAGIVESNGLTAYVDEEGNLVLSDIILLDPSEFSSHEELAATIEELAEGAAEIVEFAYQNENVEIGEFLFGSFDATTGEADLLASGFEFSQKNCDIALLFGESLFNALDSDIVDSYYSEEVMMDWYVNTLIDIMPEFFPEEGQLEWDPNAAFRDEMLVEFEIDASDIALLFENDNQLVVITDNGEIDLNISDEISQANSVAVESIEPVESTEVVPFSEDEVAALVAVA